MAEANVDANAQTVKKCFRCGIAKPIAEFRRDSQKKDGRYPICNACRQPYERAYRAAHRDCFREYQRTYRGSHKERRAVVDKAWRERNKDRVRLRRQKYEKKNRDKIRYKRALRRLLKHGPPNPRLTPEERKERKRAYAKTHKQLPHVKEKARIYRKEKYHADLLGSREYQRLWQERNKEKVRAKREKWRIAHKPEKAARERQRQAIKRKATVGDIATIKQFYRFVHTAPKLKCYWCKQETKVGQRHVDHIVPISKGGPHAIHNLCCSCSKCNNQKHNKLPEEFSGQFELPFSATP